LKDARLLEVLPRMKPWTPTGLTGQQWALADLDRNYLVYSASGGKVRFDLSATRGTFTVYWVDPRTGAFAKVEEPIGSGTMIDLSGPGTASRVLWLTRP
jgi:hypothetical protein